MNGPETYLNLPDDLPRPTHDGACAHLPGLAVPHLLLWATDGRQVDLAAAPGRTVVYIYPRTGAPSIGVPAGWDAIPGARGCTPQSCAFRDHYAELQALGVTVYGLSAQDSAYQQEAVERLHLPFPLLSDDQLTLAHALDLPTFSFDGAILLKRVTLILRDGAIEHVFYPVFPPDANAGEVISWLTAHPSDGEDWSN